MTVFLFTELINFFSPRYYFICHYNRIVRKRTGPRKPFLFVARPQRCQRNGRTDACTRINRKRRLVRYVIGCTHRYVNHSSTSAEGKNRRTPSPRSFRISFWKFVSSRGTFFPPGRLINMLAL